MLHYYTPTNNNEVVTTNDVNTQGQVQLFDVPTPEEERALLTYEEDFRTFEAELERRELSDLPLTPEQAINSALSSGFVFDESTECNFAGCTCSRTHA